MNQIAATEETLLILLFIITGVAFALQEIIASVAGWLAITLSNFFKTGDRVELGGIKGDEITIPVRYGCQLTDGKDRLFPRTLKEVNAGNGRIPLASTTFHLVETPVFDVRVVNAEGK